MPRHLLPILVILALLVGGGLYLTRDADGPTAAEELGEETRTFDSDDWMERACALPEKQLVRLWRGHDKVHSEDVTTVPLPPNYSGGFGITSHSGPWEYLQRVPLVLYGPGIIEERGPLDGFASVADIYPTAGALTGVQLPARHGRVLSDALAEDGPTPKLIVTVVWDGVGRNVLDHWEGRWPNLARMEREGTSFLRATVGSSPSITPATHASMGTGSFPVDHRVTAIEYRGNGGDVRGVLPGKNPADLALTTFADEIDRALGNQPIAGMLAWKNWHLGMLGHGASVEGGDTDQLALIGSEHQMSGLPGVYETPAYLERFPGLEEHAEELDRSDGEADGEWRGRPVLEQHDNPAWVRWQTDAILAMLEREGYGSDATPDMFFTNYKPTDIVAHQHNMDSPEMGETLEAQDAALGDLVAFLDREVRDYVVVVTADHGNTPPPTRSGAWPLLQSQLEDDVNAHFEVPEDSSLIETTSAAGPFLDREVADDLGVTAADVATFLNGYTIADNYKEDELPSGYEDRGDENVLAAAYPSDRIGAVLECATGSRTPALDLEA